MPADPLRSTVLLGRSLRHRNDRYVDAAFGFGVERETSVAECEKRVILADSDIAAGVPLGAALARDDIAGEDGFAAEQLQTEALAVRVAPVARRAACFLVCHRSLRTRVLLNLI